MKHCAFLTLDDPSRFVIDDELAHEPLAELGWRVSWPSWRQTEAPWGQFDAVIIRSPWDYQAHSAAFVGVLEAIGRSGTRLANPLAIVRWNLAKTYLKELEEAGVPIVPTLWGTSIEPARFEDFFNTLESDELVIKPVIGANGEDAFRIGRADEQSRMEYIARRHDGGEFMIQPFMSAVLSEGEYSLFYFNGQYSHAILKTPAEGEFRSQEERGSSLAAIDPEARLLARADQAMAVVSSVVPEPVLYSRIDLVRDAQGDFRVMEVELIEPSLYLRMDPGAPMRFARAVDEWFGKG
jgi:glutathione synthase/RimK-type ligase-like ATP-grasp enzyme